MLSAKKSKFQKFFDYLIIPLKKSGLSANQVTFISLLLVFVFSYFLISSHYIIALAFLMASILLDALDGHLARANHTVSIYGAYLDTVIDRYVDFIIYFSFLFISLPAVIFGPEVWIALCLFGSLMTTYSKAAFAEKAKKDFSGGFFERAERMLAIILGVFLLNFSPYYLVYVLIILAVLTNLSAIDRILRALKLCMGK